MRILVANTPKMYREAIAISLLLNRPDAEVLLGPLGALGGSVGRFGPDLAVLDRGDGALLDGLPAALPRLEIRLGARMDGWISANGGVTEIEDIDTQDLLTLVVEVEKTIPEGAAR